MKHRESSCDANQGDSWILHLGWLSLRDPVFTSCEKISYDMQGRPLFIRFMRTEEKWPLHCSAFWQYIQGMGSAFKTIQMLNVNYIS